MSTEHSPAKATSTVAQGGPPSEGDNTYWNALIDETAAGDFLDLTARTMQAMRQRGSGPRFVRLSSRCIKYRRIDLREHAEARLRTSTSDPGQAAA